MLEDVKLARRKLLLLALAVAAIIGVAIAGYWIYSNIVSVVYTPPKFTLTLEVNQIGDYEINLTAVLTVKHFGGLASEPVANAEIHFYRTYENGTIIEELGTKYTNTDGVATLIWKVPDPEAPDNVTYYFMAGYFVAQPQA
jgi:hypothetical protein